MKVSWLPLPYLHIHIIKVQGTVLHKTGKTDIINLIEIQYQFRCTVPPRFLEYFPFPLPRPSGKGIFYPAVENLDIVISV
jgi:hypothetical protein